nr:MAG TPA: hypothetical protein [Caudoviricetes sp.]DAN06609.1 MAG TPA: hypothetical protein [Caudoviricetes sp.]DAO43878.1 MAG TPA: hypothetical protein [Bacteriophage sp.]
MTLVTNRRRISDLHCFCMIPICYISIVKE